MKMYDLIYLASKKDYDMAMSDLKQSFPDAKFEDASDSIHTHRFSIGIDVDKTEYRQKILGLGLACHSFNFRLFMMENPKECKKLIDDFLATIERAD